VAKAPERFLRNSPENLSGDNSLSNIQIFRIKVTEYRMTNASIDWSCKRWFKKPDSLNITMTWFSFHCRRSVLTQLNDIAS
jgi:hypothetical protein